MITPGGIISTIAGLLDASGNPAGAGFNQLNGPALSTRLYSPQGIVCDSNGTIYFSEGSSNIIRSLKKDGSNVWQIRTIAGGNGSTATGFTDGYGISALFYNPSGLALDGSGNLFIIDIYNYAIRKLVISTGQVKTITRENGTGYPYGNGTNVKIFGSVSSSLVYDGSGYLYIPDNTRHCIWQFNLTTGLCIQYSGSLGYGYVDGYASSAQFYVPSGIARFGNKLYISDLNNLKLRSMTLGTTAGWVQKMYFGSPDANLSTISHLTYSGTSPPTNAIGGGIEGQYYIDTVARTLYQYAYNNGSLVTTLSPVTGTIMGVVADSNGNVYICGYDRYVIYKYTNSNQTISVIAGTPGTSGYSGDEDAATSALLGQPSGITIDASGNIYFTDSANHTVRMITTNGIIRSIAGNFDIDGNPVGAGFTYGAGPANGAAFNQPGHITCDSSGNLYVCDRYNYRIRKLYKDGSNVWQTIVVAGNASSSFLDGYGVSATFANPSGLTLDSSGNLFVLDSGNSAIRKIVLATGQVTTIARANGTGYLTGNGTNVVLSLSPNNNITYDNSGKLFFTTSQNGGTIYMFNLTSGFCGRYSGGPDSGFLDGASTSAKYYSPSGIFFRNNALYIADVSNTKVRKLSFGVSSDWVPIMSFSSNQVPNMLFSGTIAPTNAVGNQYQGQYYINTTDKLLYQYNNNTGSTVTTAYQNAIVAPNRVYVDASGNVFIDGDSGTTIYRFSPSNPGSLTLIAGGNGSGYAGDGTAARNATTRLTAVRGITKDSSGNIYYADNYNIRKILASNGFISTIAGVLDPDNNNAPVQGFNVLNGPALTTQINGIGGMISDSSGNIYFTDAYNNLIRSLTKDASGNLNITTIAGGNGNTYYGFGDGTGVGALFFYPGGITRDTSGNLFVLDTQNAAIRKVTIATGQVITIIRGNGTNYNFAFNLQNDIIYDGSGNLFFNDTTSKIWRLNLTSGYAAVFSGAAAAGFVDGSASSAQFNLAAGMYYSSGSIYIADVNNQKLRQLTLGTGSDWVQVMDFKPNNSITLSVSVISANGVTSGYPMTGLNKGDTLIITASGVTDVTHGFSSATLAAGDSGFYIYLRNGSTDSTNIIINADSSVVGSTNGTGTLYAYASANNKSVSNSILYWNGSTFFLY